MEQLRNERILFAIMVEAGFARSSGEEALTSLEGGGISVLGNIEIY
jgi:hypothetical protein